jgi:hypothetical protein
MEIEKPEKVVGYALLVIMEEQMPSLKPLQLLAMSA